MAGRDKDIHRHECQLQRALDQLTTAVVYIDQEERYRIVNERYSELVGSPAEQVLGRTVRETLGDKAYACLAPRLARALAGENLDVEVQFPYPKAGMRFVRLAYRADRAGNRVLGVTITIHDVTAQKEAEEELRRAKLAAEEGSHAKDRFLAALSHELRTPLTPVLATVSLLETDQRLDEDLRQDLQTIRRNVELEARLIDDLLDLTRISHGKLELRRQETDLHLLIERAISVCCQPEVFGKQLKVVTKLQATEHHLWADPTRIEQVMWNLLSNAVKFTPASGRIEVRTSNPAQGRVCVEVQDSGAGIDPSDLDRIFDTFQQVNRSAARQFGGLGLGLAIVRAIVRMHGGTIRVFSKGMGTGATFSVDLPILIHATPGEDVTSPLVDRKPSSGTRILLVEDHADTARVLKQLLMARGYEVQVADRVHSALELARQEEFDLVISDLGLPDGSGLDLVRRLRDLRPQLPSIALSGYGQPEDIRQSREAGFSEHLIKPIDADSLEAAVSRLTVTN